MEPLVDLPWNRWSISRGTTGRFEAEYASFLAALVALRSGAEGLMRWSAGVRGVSVGWGGVLARLPHQCGSNLPMAVVERRYAL